jgi:hypothetical protein
MELTASEEQITEEFPAVGAGLPAARYPLENPRIAPIPGDPLCEPHPSEPGVGPNGEAAPLENPGHPFPMDPFPGGERGSD